MKVLFADFQISKYGGIVEYVASMLKAFRDLGCEVDVAQMTPASTTQSAYNKKVKEFETGEHQRKIKFHSQAGGYEKDEVTGYWRNNYYGYFLPPSNRIGVYEKDAVERWKKLAGNFDIILWNFMPTKSSAWNKKGVEFDFWWKFFDLPKENSQVFLCHDAYFNVRASNISALKDKIMFMACAHLAAYQCCSEIGIPRSLLLNPRYLPSGAKMTVKMMNKRKEDFFAAHMFKSMKHMEELIAAVPYIQKGEEERFKVKIAGTGIEYNYMTSETKTKSNYMCTTKRDPNLPAKLDGKLSLWDRAEKFGMEYMGQMSGGEVIDTLKNTKFAIDPSWAEHYARYCRTHINGFIIEAMLCGAYPVLRDYRGLAKVEGKEIYDPLFENVRAIIIPWDATPKEFAEALKKAAKMSPAKFLKDTKYNFELVHELFNATKNAEEIIRLVKGGRKLVRKELEKGKDSPNVKKITHEIMEEFYHIELPIEWETD
jgi:glycosyltransferase involved in cell wall biosynthesis